jgi:hypothetical protein
LAVQERPAHAHELWGLPGETPQDYLDLAPKIDLLTHLQPPGSVATTVLLRFSPLYHQAERFGLRDLRHYHSYDWVYGPLPEEARENLSYYFDFEHDGLHGLADYTRPVREAITRWETAYLSSILFFEDDGENVDVWDTRPCATSPHLRLSGADRAAFHALREPKHVASVMSDIANGFGAAAARSALEDLQRHRLVFADGDLWTNVAIDARRYPGVSASHETTYMRQEKLALLRTTKELLAELAPA